MNMAPTLNELAESDENFLLHISNRVCISSFLAAFNGGIHGMYKGHPAARSAYLSASSTAMCASALFTVERLAAYGIAAATGSDPNSREPFFLLQTHAIGGILGGAQAGYTYTQKPLRGVLIFLPLMIGIAGLEMMYGNIKNEKMQIRRQEMDAMDAEAFSRIVAERE
jgi:hypothetical protein